MYTKRASKASAHTAPIYSVQWTAGGDIVTGSLDETVCIWSHQHTTGTDESGGHGKDSFVQKKVYDGHDLGVISALVHQDGKQMAVSSLDCQVRLYNMEKGTLVNEVLVACQSCGFAYVEVCELRALRAVPRLAVASVCV